MMAYWDRDLVCRVANRAFEKWFGVEAEALVGVTIGELLGANLYELIEPHILGALRGEAQTFERAVPDGGGKERQSLVHYIPDVREGVVLGFVAYLTDVTPLKQTQAKLEHVIATLETEIRQRRTVEDQLAEIQRSLAVTLASIGAGYMATDRLGHVTRMNEVAERTFGWPESEAQGQIVWNVFTRDDRPTEMLDRNPVDVMIENRVTVAKTHEVVAVSRNGERTPLEVRSGLTYDDSGVVQGMVMVFRDLTQLRQTEAERHRAEQRFALVVESAPNGLLMVDAAGVIVLTNKKVEELLGYSCDELTGMAIDRVVPAATASTESREAVARRKDNRELPVQLGVSPVEMPDGSFLLASITDITERKRVEAELRRSNSDLEQFAYVASHDLQEPLRMVSTFTELLAETYRGNLDAQADEYIHYVVDGARRMQHLIRDLLAFSRVGSQGKTMRPTSLDDVLRGVLKLLGTSIADAHATIHLPPLPVVLGDAALLAQVFTNLLSNALKFRSTEPLVVAIEARRHNDDWCIVVKDNGIGIQPEYNNRIFMMFQRLHERGKYEGSGIGLAIVKKVIEVHGGRVWVESSIGNGAMFCFTLPPA